MGVVQLADFGVSRLLNMEEQTHVVTQTHGTACFMPPEMLKSGHLSAAADVYSFALVMYQLFSRKVGALVFSSVTPPAFYSLGGAPAFLPYCMGPGLRP